MKIWRSIWLILLLIVLFLGIPFLLVNWNQVEPMIASFYKKQIETVSKDAPKTKEEAVEKQKAEEKSVLKHKTPEEKSVKKAETIQPVFQGVEIQTGQKGRVLGLAPKGWTVKLKSDKKVVGSTVANKKNGQWLIVVDNKVLQAGKHTFLLEVLSPDNKVSLMSRQSMQVKIFEEDKSTAEVVVLEKGKPSVFMQKGVVKKKVPVASADLSSSGKSETKKAEARKETLEIGTLDYKSGNEGKIELAAKGVGEPGQKVEFFVNGKVIGSSKVDNKGRWQFERNISLKSGNNQFKVTQNSEVLMRTMTYTPVQTTSSISKVSKEVEERRKAVRAANLAKEAEKAKKAKKAEQVEVRNKPVVVKKAKELKKTVKASEKPKASQEKRIALVAENKKIKVKTMSVPYTVIRGDSLWGISDKHYGNGQQYWKIYKRNRSRIRTPDLIYPGQKFIIP